LFDVAKVAGIIREIAEEQVLPRFQALADHEVQEKVAGELVTVVDLAVEDHLTRRLTELLPGSLVVGEEAVHADPALMDRLASDAPVWIIDPIDGTRNFAHGRPVFAIMVALAKAGRLSKIFTIDRSDFAAYRIKRGHRHHRFEVIG